MEEIARSERLIIRKFVQDDLSSFAEYRADPSNAEFQSWSDYTLEDAQALYDKMNAVPFGTEGHWFQLAIASTGSNQLMGDLAVHFIDKDQVEVGFTMAPEFQRKGIAAEALMLLLNFLFKDLNKHRVIAMTDARNEASRRLLEKVGFRKEAHFVDSIFFKGAWGSEFSYALLHSEWN